MLKFVNIKKKINYPTYRYGTRTYVQHLQQKTNNEGRKTPSNTVPVYYNSAQLRYRTEACYLQTVSDDEDSSLGQADVLRPKGSELDELGLTGSGQQLDCLIHSAALLGTQIFV